MAKKKKLKKALAKLTVYVSFLYDELQTTRNQMSAVQLELKGMKLQEMKKRPAVNFDITDRGF